MQKRILSLLVLLAAVVMGAVAQTTYKVSVKEGTEDASNWQGKAGTGDYQSLPLEGVAANTAVSVKYSGTKMVKSVKAVKKAAKTDLLSGVFSVSASKKVNFSKGNLRYASSKWSFFDNQYDYYTDYSADAWDKFGWSTSATTYGMNTSTDNATYSGDFVDWGATMGTGWFTLSSDEWTYLLNTRTASIVGGTTDGRYAKAKVNDVQGIILFPDTYTHPDGVTPPTGVNAEDVTGWNGNDYSSADWTKMESAGCVFLPAAGYRGQASVKGAGSYGYYWSSSPYISDAYRAYLAFFSSGTLNPASYSYRNVGYSVRLVQATSDAAAAARTLAEVTAGDIGKIVGKDGKIYATKADAEAVATGNAVAMIAYVGTASDCTHGLAIALADESGTKTYEDAGTACSGKEAVTGGTWRLPSIKDWQYMLIGCGASGSYSDNPNQMSCSELASKLNTAQGDALQTGHYWSSTEAGNEYVWTVYFGGDYAPFYNVWEGFEYRVRACLAFTVEQAAKPAATVTTAPTGAAVVGVGKGTALVSGGVADGGTLWYAVTTTNTKPASTDGFSDAVPTAQTITASGKVYVWYYVKGDDTHTDSEIAATAIEVPVADIVWDVTNVSDLYVAGTYIPYEKEGVTLSSNANRVQAMCFVFDDPSKDGIAFDVMESGGYTFTAPTGKAFTKIEMKPLGPSGWYEAYENEKLGTGWAFVIDYENQIYTVTWKGSAAASTVGLLTGADEFHGQYISYIAFYLSE